MSPLTFAPQLIAAGLPRPTHQQCLLYAAGWRVATIWRGGKRQWIVWESPTGERMRQSEAVRRVRRPRRMAFAALQRHGDESAGGGVGLAPQKRGRAEMFD